MIAQQEEQARRRLEDDKRVLLEQLAQATLQVNQKQRELDQQREQWESATKDDQQRKNDEQFLQIVKQYEQLSPKQGKRMLMELVSQNKTQQAVAYLRAMNMRAASRILKEFKTDSEIALATELLEKLRTYGKTDEQATDPQRGPALAAASAPHAGSSNANAPADDSR